MAEAVNVPINSHLADDPTWRAWFRGLFWGEGWLGIDLPRIRRNGGKAPYHRASIQVSQTLDNRAMLEHIHSVLGGSIYDRKKDYGSQGAKQLFATWMIRGSAGCRKVVDILKEETYYIDKKADKLQALDEFIALTEDLNGAKRTEEILMKMDELRAIVAPKSKPRVR